MTEILKKGMKRTRVKSVIPAPVSNPSKRGTPTTKKGPDKTGRKTISRSQRRLFEKQVMTRLDYHLKRDIVFSAFNEITVYTNESPGYRLGNDRLPFSPLLDMAENMTVTGSDDLFIPVIYPTIKKDEEDKTSLLRQAKVFFFPKIEEHQFRKDGEDTAAKYGFAFSPFVLSDGRLVPYLDGKKGEEPNTPAFYAVPQANEAETVYLRATLIKGETMYNVYIRPRTTLRVRYGQDHTVRGFIIGRAALITKEENGTTIVQTAKKEGVDLWKVISGS